MKRFLTVFMTLCLALTTLTAVQAEDEIVPSPLISEQEIQNASTFQYYNITLTNGFHSADSADVEGPMFVAQDSNLGREYITFSYGAMFNKVHNGVGDPLEDDQLVALAIGGQVNNYSDANIRPSLGDATKSSGWLMTDEDTNSWISAAFGSTGVGLGQRKIIGTQFNDVKQSIDRSVGIVNNALESLVSSYHPYMVNGSQVKTLGDYIDGRYVNYDIYQSDIDAKILIVNIPPDAEGVMSVDVMGFDYASIINNSDIDQIFVTSFNRDSQGHPVHAKKVIFKGNFMANHLSHMQVLELSDAKASEHVRKVSYFFPEATQVTNFYDRVNWNTIKAPRDIEPNNPGVVPQGQVNAGDLAFNKAYLKQYATGSSSNGSAENGGGPAAIGSVIAPKAAVVLSGGNINGLLVSNDLHQRNGAEVHNFRNNWFDKTPENGDLKLIKKDAEDQSLLKGAKFIIYKEGFGEWLYYNNTAGVITWTNVYADATPLETNDAGEIELKNLELGRYYLMEIAPPDGYEPNSEIYPVDIIASTGGAAHVSEVVVLNYKLNQPEPLGSIEIFKYYETNTALEGAEFILYRMDGSLKQYYTGIEAAGMWSHDLQSAKRLISDSSGKVKVENLEYGTYIIYEEKAPEGFDPNTEEMTLTIPNASNESDIEVPVENTEYDPWGPTDPNHPKGSIILEKYNEDFFSETLEGAEFILSLNYKGETRFLSDVQGTVNTWSPDKNEAYRLRTDASGRVSIDNLKFGIYTFEEVTPPSGFEPLDRLIEVILTPNQNETDVQILSKVPNRKRLGDLELTKVQTDTNMTLRGAEYILYRDHGVKEYYVGNNHWTTHLANALKLRTGNDGKISVSDISFDTYYFQETKAPAGHILNDEPLKLVLDDSNGTASVQVKHENELIPERLGSLSLVKTDGSGNKLEGAEFVLFRNITFPEYYGIDGEWTHYVDEAKIYTSDSTGQVAQDNLTLGIYYFQETKAPDGYILNDTPLKIVLDATNNPASASIDMSNDKEPVLANGSITLSKVDAENAHVSLAGAEFVLYRNALIPRYYVDKDTWSINIEDAAVLTTNHLGKLTVNDLLPGKYYFKETKAPDGFVLDETPVEIVLTGDNEPPHATIIKENEAIKAKLGSIELNKIDGDDNNVVLKDAEFVLYRNSSKREYYKETGLGNVVWTPDKSQATILKTNANGKITVTDLEFGAYFFEEVKAPDGYKPNTHPFLVILDDLNDPAFAFVDVENFRIRGSVILEKQDAENIQTVLEGAEFVLLRNRANPQYYHIDGIGQISWTADKAKASKLTSDALGIVKADKLDLGTYYFQETKAPDGYVLDETLKEVILTAEHNPASTKVTKENTRIKGSLELSKVDEDGEILKDAEFVLYKNAATPEYYSKNALGLVSWVSDKTNATVFKTSTTGKFVIDNLELGTYYLQETKAPVGHVLDETPHEVTLTSAFKISITHVNKRVRGSLELIKRDSEDTTITLKGAEFVLFKNLSAPEYYQEDRFGSVSWVSDKTQASTLTSDDLGVVSVNNLEMGTYYFQETKAPDGYLLNDTPQVVVLDETHEPVKASTVIDNTKIRGSLVLAKVDHDDETTVLKDAEFVLFKNSTSPLYYVLDGSNVVTWVSDKAQASILKTDTDGKIRVNNLELGTYYFQETKAPDGYVLDENPIEIILDQSLDPVSASVTKKNSKTAPLLGTVELLKHEKDDEALVLKDASFILFRNATSPEYYHSDNQGNITWLSAKESASVLKTNALGLIAVGGLELGTYYFQETIAPAGYELDETPLEVILTDANDPAKTSVSMANEKIIGAIELIKHDADDSTLVLEDAEFILFRNQSSPEYYVLDSQNRITWTATKQDATVLTTDALGTITVIDLFLGTYYFEETKAPEGYLLDDTPREVILSGTTSPATISILMENHKQPAVLGAIELLKRDEEDSSVVLQGAEFVVFRNALNPEYYAIDSQNVISWHSNKVDATVLTSDALGLIRVSDLALDTYYFQETKAPDGYILDETPLEVILSNGAQPIVAQVVKENGKVAKPLGTLVLNKVDDEDPSIGLSGAEFVLFKDAANPHYYYSSATGDISWVTDRKLATLLKTDSTGQISISNLELGTYYFQEAKAPDGYILNEIVLEIILDGSIVPARAEVSMENTKQTEIITGSVSLIKVDRNDPSVTLEGAEFIFFRKSPNLEFYHLNQQGEVSWVSALSEATSIPTNLFGQINIDDLELGTYYFQETKAPDGYIIDKDEVAVVLDQSNNPASASVTKTNAKVEPSLGSVELLKVDAIDPTHVLKDAEFVLFRNLEGYYANSDGIVSWVQDIDQASHLKTNEKGLISVEGLPFGLYHFKEMKAPNGYVSDGTPIEFEITETETHQPMHLEFANHKTVIQKMGSLSITKVDLDQPDKVLQGAHFILSHNGKYYISDGTWSDNRDEAEVLVTDSNGVVEVASLEFGTYHIQEVKAPIGYQLNSTIYDIVVNETHAHVAMRIANKKQSDDPSLPETGQAVNNTTYLLAGGLIAVGVIVMLVKRKRDDK